MLFNSKIFVALLAVVLAVYYGLPERAKVWFLLAISLTFYGYWDASLLWMLMANIGINFLCGIRVYENQQAGDPAIARRWLWLSLAFSLGTLGFFKYYDFFVEELITALHLLGADLSPERYLLHLLLPAGISFYTFQTLSYTIDVYRGDLPEPDRDFVRFALYVTFFPQLVAGPVERAPHLLPQFYRPFRLSRAMVYEGVFLILLGFVKKVVIADRLARYIAPYYEMSVVDGAKAAVSMLLFTCQIYVDFSSYSDIAIGLGLLLGYHIRPNFNLPFVVPSVPERWRRWHISMSQWFRDYIFIPLGGSRKGELRTQINILTVMFLSGLWHGASNNFLIWGLLNGATMLAHRNLTRPLDALSSFFGRNPVAERGYFYLCCWNTFCTIASINIFFRCPDWEGSVRFIRAIYLSGLSSYQEMWSHFGEFPDELKYGMCWTVVVFAAHEAERYLKLKDRILSNRPLWIAVCLAFFWVVVTFGISGPQFIYYQF